MEKISTLQNNFQKELYRYINGGCFSRKDIFFSILLPFFHFYKNAKKILKYHGEFLVSTQNDNYFPVNLSIKVYKGINPYVLRMMKYLKTELNDDLLGAYIHGSLGAYDEIAYSDFDALAIIKDDVFENLTRLIKVAKKLNSARKIMLGFDPLQHHGWFVLTEADLRNYCNAYFPVELFKYAKSLFNDKGLKLTIILRDSREEINEAFKRIANDIINKINQIQYPLNMYQLKSLLSGFMLLPSLYVQLRDGRGIFKRESFNAAKVDFNIIDWSIMDEVSYIRSKYYLEIGLIKKWLISRGNFLSNYMKKKISPKIPPSISKALTPQFYSRMCRLTNSMKKKSESYL